MEIYNNMSLQELEEKLVQWGEKKFRGRQIYEGIHKQGVLSIDNMTNLSKSLREKLKEKGSIKTLDILEVFSSKLDDTKKFVLECEDGNVIEAVYMKYSTHSTLCISSQIGCKMGCVFCASTKERFGRSLEKYEMLDQIYRVNEYLNTRIDNVVIMGIGEPLENYENVTGFIRMITDDKGYGMSIRSVTLSTCGIVPKIYQLGEDQLPINLAISLHNPFNEERKKLMPIGKKYSIEEILQACDYFFKETGRRVSYEYTLIAEENDSPRYSRKLAELLKGRNCHLNLIPLNPIKEYGKDSSSDKNVSEFCKYMNSRGVTTTVRRKQGQDIEGACGQLRANYIRDERSNTH
ncbi:MAG: 23S rRNA (adenine(2503)-C(2))-methyltransferase RlmN [Gallicola sp.]|nr:23S rRNA (adenine(2503)-C(2))-methyltransferase RlmN [Gallicola sp.]